MITKYVTIRMTVAEALEFRSVAGNGYGDGDYYYGENKVEHRRYLCAMGKFEEAIETVRGKFLHRMGTHKEG